MKRDRAFRVRLSAEERISLSRAAKSHGYSNASEMVRDIPNVNIQRKQA